MVKSHFFVTSVQWSALVKRNINKVRYIHITTSRCISIIYIKLLGLKRLSWHHRRTGQHPFGGGGQTEFCPNGFGVGGGVVADIFRDPNSVGGGVVADNSAPDSVVVAEFVPLTP